jgi:hypothetical protein
VRAPKNVVELEDVTTSDIESINPTQVEEETSITTQGEVGQSADNRNDISNPKPETPAKPDETTGQQEGRDEEEVMVENVTNRPDSEREEDDKETIEADPYIIS